MFEFNLVKLRNYAEVVISVLLMLSSVFSFVKAPNVVCMFSACKNLSKTTILTIYPRAIATGCVLSRIIIMYNKSFALNKYEGKIKEYDLHYPVNRDKKKFRRHLVLLFVAVCATAIIPINVYRLALLNVDFPRSVITFFFAMIYTQNLSQCVSELYFFAHCFGLFQRFQTINDEVSKLKSETILTNRYPIILKSDEHGRGRDRAGLASKSDCLLMVKACPLVNTVEQLKLRHKYISNAVRRLNELYGFLLGLSLCVLFLMTLSDIYEILSLEHRTAGQNIFYYAWLFQYGFRFCMIVTTTHITTKEAHKTKSLITDINSGSVDNSTKEEIQLFLNEISSRSVEFTTFDLFILNIHLIISAFVTGTTYLVILFQFK